MSAKLQATTLLLYDLLFVFHVQWTLSADSVLHVVLDSLEGSTLQADVIYVTTRIAKVKDAVLAIADAASI